MRGRILLTALSLIAVSLSACGRAEAPAAPPPPEVTVATPLSRQVMDWDEFPGRFEAPQTVEVRARVGGYIRQVHFHDGDYVRQGQLLFTLDPRNAQASVASAQAQRGQAQAQLNLANAEFGRAETLKEKGFLAQSALDIKRANVQTAQAALAAADAAVRTARLDLEFTRVTAPASGRISDRRVDPGNLIAGGSSGGDILTSIVSTSPIHFVFDASEAILLRYQRAAGGGQSPLRVRLQDETGFTHAGYLDFTDNAVDSASGVVRLRGVINNADGFLRPGMYGQVQLAGSGSYQAMLVPDAAIVTDQARRVVYVVGADNKAVQKPVELGPLVDGLRVVRSGLAAGDRVVINGGQRIQMPGTVVKPVAGRIAPAAQTRSAPTTTAAPAASATFAAG